MILLRLRFWRVVKPVAANLKREQVALFEKHSAASFLHHQPCSFLYIYIIYTFQTVMIFPQNEGVNVDGQLKCY